MPSVSICAHPGKSAARSSTSRGLRFSSNRNFNRRLMRRACVPDPQRIRAPRVHPQRSAPGSRAPPALQTSRPPDNREYRRPRYAYRVCTASRCELPDRLRCGQKGSWRQEYAEANGRSRKLLDTLICCDFSPFTLKPGSPPPPRSAPEGTSTRAPEGKTTVSIFSRQNRGRSPGVSCPPLPRNAAQSIDRVLCAKRREPLFLTRQPGCYATCGQP